jgi:hypothetical protein
MAEQDKPTSEEETEQSDQVRQGVKLNEMRWVLAISLILAVIAIIVVLAVI